MGVVGICSICGAGHAMYTCSLCGRIVCGNCFDSKHGVCKNCKKGKTLK